MMMQHAVAESLAPKKNQRERMNKLPANAPPPLTFLPFAKMEAAGAPDFAKRISDLARKRHFCDSCLAPRRENAPTRSALLSGKKLY
jgi:hypothetical protein